MKPDVSAPGVDVTSSVPPRDGTWADFSGTSMAAPHVAGAAALLRQRHPAWTVAQIKSALVQTGDPRLSREAARRRRRARAAASSTFRAPTTRCSSPTPTGLSFGLLRAGTSATRTIALTDAGGGAGAWTVSIAQQSTARGVSLTTAADA